MTNPTRTASHSWPRSGSDRPAAGRLLAGLLASAALALVAPPGRADGLPSGGTAVHGKVSIAKPASNRMRIRQTSKSAIVNWNGFSIRRGAGVEIVQPSKKAAILNRVTGGTKSSIRGRLSANGQVYLVNPNGIEITASGKVRAGGFVASTLDIADRDFREGRRVFSSDGTPAAVRNAGVVEVRSLAALLGGKVENSGVIRAELGSVGLGAGKRATLKLSGDILQVALPDTGEDGGALIRNSGLIEANGGRIEIRAATAREAARQAINLSGVAQAKRVSRSGGAIVLDGGAGGSVTVSGSLDASAGAATRGRGGSVTVTGDDIHLAGARVDVSGPDGGGTARIGGGIGGKGPLPRARTTTVDEASVIAADATRAGPGGSVVVWSDDVTRFAGAISARGGPDAGPGGFAEVSGKRLLAFTGTADLRGAPFGTLLLDPFNVLITDDPTNGMVPGEGVSFFPTQDDSILNATELEALLEAANVTVTTQNPDGLQAGNIGVLAPLAWDAASLLILDADGDISFESTIDAANGGLIAAAIGAITTTDAAAINVSALNWTAENVGIGGQITAQSGAVQSRGDITVAGAGLSLGAFTLNAATNVVLDAPLAGGSVSITAGGGGIQTTAAGAIALGSLTLNAGGQINALGSVNVGLFQLESGDWSQEGDPLPAFEADDFQVSEGTATFLRVLGGNGDNLPFLLGDIYGVQGVSGFLNLNFALNNVIVASGTSGWNEDELGAFAGFDPIGNFDDSGLPIPFTGDFDGAGFAIDGLTITRGDNQVGLFAALGTGAEVTDLTLTGANVLGGYQTGILAGEIAAGASVSGVSVAGAVGGYYGYSAEIGGLAGVNAGSILDSTSSASVTASVAQVAGGGVVTAGGLVGDNQGTIAASSASGAVLGDVEDDGLVLVGGLAGASTGSITGAEATGTVTGSVGGGGVVTVGGLVGDNQSVIEESTASGAVSADGADGATVTVGGLAGTNISSITDSFASGAVTGTGVNADIDAGGLVGTSNGGTLQQVFASGDVVIAGLEVGATAGGLVGNNLGDIVDAYARGSVTTTDGGAVGGLVGVNSGSIDRTYSTGAVSGDVAGGLVGVNDGGIVSGSFWDIETSGTGFSAGGVGLTTAELQDTAGFFALADAAGWNFETTWAPSSAGFYPEIYTINAVVRVDPDGADRQYGLDTNPPFTIAQTFGGPDLFVFGPAGDTLPDFSGNLSSDADGTSGVGDYDILASGTATSPLGQVYRATTLLPGTLTVTPALLTITANPQSKTYGTDFIIGGAEFTFAPAPLYNDDRIDSVTLVSEGADGTAKVASLPYAIIASDAVGFGLENYDIDYVNGAFTVNLAPLTITANDQSKTYGTNFVFDGTEFTFAPTPLFNNDRIDSVSLVSDGAGEGATVTVPTSTYSIVVSNALGEGLENYDIDYDFGAFTVNQAPLTITANPQSKTYGESFVFNGTEFTFAPAPLFNNDRIDSVTLVSAGAGGAATVAGSRYAIVASNARGSGLENYAIRYFDGSFTVNRAPLTITANNQVKPFGDQFVFVGTEFGVAGLRNADRVDEALLSSGGAAAGAAVGSYPIDIGAARGVGLDNYDIAYVPGDLEVERRPLPPGTDIVPLLPQRVVPLPNPPVTIEVAVVPAGVTAGGPPPEPLVQAEEAPSGEPRAEKAPPREPLAQAEETLAFLRVNSPRLRAAACRQSVTETDAYLACLGVALDTYAAVIDARILDLPPPLRGVAATIRAASAAVREARATAARRMEGAGSRAEAAAIEREAMASARDAVARAAAEVRASITLLRADEPQLARLEAAQGEEIADALDTVADGLVRAVGL